MNRALDPEVMKAWNKGKEAGIKEGRAHARDFFLNWLEGLEHEHGIGKKTAEKIRDRFYKQYEIRDEE